MSREKHCSCHAQLQPGFGSPCQQIKCPEAKQKVPAEVPAVTKFSFSPTSLMFLKIGRRLPFKGRKKKTKKKKHRNSSRPFRSRAWALRESQ